MVAPCAVQQPISPRGVDRPRCVSDYGEVDDEEFPTEPIRSPGDDGVRIRGVNGWTIIVRTDLATRLVSLDTEDPEGRLVGNRILGTDDCQRLVDALHAALEQNRTSGGPVMIDVSQVIGRD